jgi:hypothetical protein
MFAKHLLAAALLLPAALPAAADPLPRGHIPEDARWVLHVNIDAARNTPAWELLRTRFVEPQHPQLDEKLRLVEALTGVKVPQDLHDLTFFGSAFDDTAVCLLIHAPFDQDRTTTFLKLDREFSTLDHHGHTILTWRDKDRDRLMYGAFAGPDLAVVAPTAKMVGLALDTLDGKSPAVKPTSPLAPPSPPRLSVSPVDSPRAAPVLWLAALTLSDLPRVQKVDSPFLLQVDDASLALTLADDKLAARLAVTAKNDKAAQQLTATAEGLRAMIQLSAADEHAPVRVKVLASALQNLALRADGKSVTVDWTLSSDKLEALAELARPAPPATGPAGGPGTAAGNGPKPVLSSPTP